MLVNSKMKREIEIQLDAIDRIQSAAAEAGRELNDDERLAVENALTIVESKKKEHELLEAKLGEVVARIPKSPHFNGGNSMTTTVPAKAIAKSTTCFKSNQDAYDSGRWIQAVLLGDPNSHQYCRERGLVHSAMTGGDNLKGGNLVPEPLENSIIEMREQYGIMRSNAAVISMGSDTMLVPKMSSELTAYYVSENTAITPSDMTISQVGLTARKLAVLSAVSSELNEDSVISIAEMLARSVAQTFAVKEDAAGFLGDGTTTYGGIVGLDNALLAGSVFTATGHATFSALTFADFETVVGKAKLWAGSRPKWYISNAGYCASMLRLQNAAGGNNRQDLAAGVPPSFMGYPVVVTQTLPSALTGTTGTTAMFFGDLQQGVYFGSRRGVTLAIDSSVFFANDALAVRGTERYTINVHDVGDASNAGGIIKVVFG